jgi:hypothetical protein
MFTVVFHLTSSSTYPNTSLMLRRGSCPLAAFVPCTSDLVETFTAQVSYFSKICWNDIQVRRKEMPSAKHIPSVGHKKSLNKLSVVKRSVLASFSASQTVFSIRFNTTSQLLSHIIFMWGLTKAPSFIFASLIGAIVRWSYRNPSQFLFMFFAVFFVSPSLLWNEDRTTSGCFSTLVCPGMVWLRGGHCHSTLTVFAWPERSHKEQQTFAHPSCTHSTRATTSDTHRHAQYMRNTSLCIARQLASLLRRSQWKQKSSDLTLNNQ